ncbi:MAG: c-type cytochrome [Burkholderiaceae bacterium]
MSDQHSSPIKTPRQLITIVVLAFVVPVLIIVLLVKYVAGAKLEGAGTASMTPEAIADRLRPVGTVVLAEANGARALQSGEAVYNLACGACHTAGVAGAPKLGDAAQWSPRLAQGYDTLVKHAVEGFKGMPPKGGNASLDPIEVARAVVYMANRSGGKFKEPDVAAPKAAEAKFGERTGEQVVAAACVKCHETGQGGAPKIGDWVAWKPRVEMGLAKLTEAAIKGHGGMPARGGMAELSDAEMRRAIEHMFNVGKQAAPALAAAAAAAAAAKTDAAAGKKLYDSACTACHATGVAGAPKFGDKAAWAPRIQAGVDALTSSVIKGKGAMPPRGASTATDAELRSAVEYMVAAAK